MKIIKNYLWNVSYQLLIIIVPIILIPYVNKCLGPTGVGINSYTNAFAQIFVIIGDLGVTNYGSKTIAEYKSNKKVISKIFWEISLMRFITLLISCSIFLSCVLIQHQYIKFYLIQGLIIIASIFDVSWFFMGMENFKIIAFRNFFVKILTVILIFSLVKNRHDLTIYIFIMSLSLLFGNLVVAPSLRKYVKFVKISILGVLKHLKYSVIFFIPQISMQIYQTFYKFLIGKLINVKSVGFFDSSDKIMNVVLTIISALAEVVLPHISNIAFNDSRYKAKSFFYKYFDWVLIISIPMTAGVAAISLKFAPWFFGIKFLKVGPLMMIESLTIFIIGISLALSSYFMSTNQVGAYNISVILGAIVSMTLGLYLMLRFGLTGSMWGTVLTELFISSYELIILRHQLLIKKLFRNAKFYLISASLMFFVVFSMTLYINFNLIHLALEVAIGALIYILTIFIMAPNIIKKNKVILIKLLSKLK